VGLGCPSRYIVTNRILPRDFEHVRRYKGVTSGVTRVNNREPRWWEAQRAASLAEYRNLEECKAVVNQVADELKVKNHFDSD